MNVRKIVAVSTLLLVASAIPLLAGPQKKAWEWTLEERIALRTDAAAQRARMSESRSGRETSRVQGDTRSGESGVERDRIDGRAHPELLLPSEIYTIYMRAAYAYSDEPAMQFRRDIATRMAEVGLPEEIVTALEAESALFIRLQAYEEELRAKLGNASGDERSPMIAEMASIRLQACPVRADVLRRMRERFGRETFDRFLYEVLAPGAHTTFLKAPDAKTLLAEEEGCR